MANWWEEKLKGILKSEELSVRICDAESLEKFISKDCGSGWA